MAERQYWITPVNIEEYRVFDAYSTLPEIDWRLSANPEIGDIVYIYVSHAYKFVKYKTVVVAVGIKLEDTIDDSNFVTPKGREELPAVKSFTRLKLLEIFRDGAIPGTELVKRGVTNNFRNTQRLSQKCIDYLKNFDRTSNLTEGCFSYLIEECSRGKTSDGQITARNVRKVLPIVVNWAKNERSDGTYNELIEACGYTKFSGIGHVLGTMRDIIKALGNEIGEEIPTLNALVTNKETGLPGEGFDYVIKNYEYLDEKAKRKIVANLNAQAFHYKQWNWVLSLLGLNPLIDISDLVAKIRKGSFGFGGEGEEHRNLKIYISKHPETVNLKTLTVGETEHVLLSGDRLDVYFPDINVAVEVKPSSAPEEDILRGIYQCVKYKAVLDAESQHYHKYINSASILALGGRLTEKTREAAEILGVRVFEEVGIEEIKD